jgi:hypothetical protein
VVFEGRGMERGTEFFGEVMARLIEIIGAGSDVLDDFLGGGFGFSVRVGEFWG